MDAGNGLFGSAIQDTIAANGGSADSCGPGEALTFTQSRAYRIRSQLVVALLPLLLAGLGVVLFLTAQMAAAAVCALLGVASFVAFVWFAASPVTLSAGPEEVLLTSRVYGRERVRRCLRSELAGMRIRKVPPISILELIRHDGFVCLNTSIDWLRPDQLRELSGYLNLPIEDFPA